MTKMQLTKFLKINHQNKLENLFLKNPMAIFRICACKYRKYLLTETIFEWINFVVEWLFLMSRQRQKNKYHYESDPTDWPTNPPTIIELKRLAKKQRRSASATESIWFSLNLIIKKFEICSINSLLCGRFLYNQGIIYNSFLLCLLTFSVLDSCSIFRKRKSTEIVIEFLSVVRLFRLSFTCE